MCKMPLSKLNILILTLILMVISVHKTSFSADNSDSTASFNMLMAPSSPGFILLGVEPVSVDRPGTTTDLTLTVLNRTNDLNEFPRDLAMEFMPCWIFWGHKIKREDYEKDTPSANLLQSASVSIASSNSEYGTDSSMTSTAIGLRFSLLRGRIDDEFKKMEDSINVVHRLLHSEYTDSLWKGKMQKDSIRGMLLARSKFIGDKLDTLDAKLEEEGIDITEFQLQKDHYEAEADLVEASLAQREKDLREKFETEFREQNKETYDLLSQLISELPFRRIGWKMDMAGGVVLDFINNDFDKGDFNRWGIWFTGGYEWRNWSALGVFRYLGNDNDSDMATLDVGGRVILDNFKKFSLSAEAVNRSFPNMKDKASEYRAALQFDYAIARNKSVSFTFGRDFEGKQSGNLISIINIIMGFGSDRPVIK